MKRSGGHLSNRAQTVAEREVVQPAGGQRGIVWHMEDVLDIYQRPLDPARSLVCLDETSRQLLSDARPPLPLSAGRTARHDSEEVRGGMGSCRPAAVLALGARQHPANAARRGALRPGRVRRPLSRC
jgi:hypothetical protein